VRAGSAAHARSAAERVRVPTSTNGAWKVSLRGVRTGLLVVRSLARDLEGNRSRTVEVQRTLVD
jgi:hypothetical protein